MSDAESDPSAGSPAEPETRSDDAETASEAASGSPNVRHTAAELATGQRSDTLLETSGLVKQFGGFTATDEVDFAVGDDELRCLIGPNGAGKSTLLKLITGVYEPTAGNIYFNGHDVTDTRPHRRVHHGLGMKFQVPSVFGELSVRENLRLPVQQFADGEERRSRVERTLSEAGLSSVADRRADRLSHGQQQRLEIGMVASLEPELLLLDEPVAGLSVEERRGIADQVTTLNEERDLAFVVIEHDTDFVARIADEVTVLHQGEVFREGPIEEIRADPAVQRIYLGGDGDDE